MQTFLPYSSLERSVEVLDWRRLGKQRVEAWQILKALERASQGESAGWANHPAVLMWKGYESALAYYGLLCCWEWRSRGYVDNMEQRFLDLNPSYDSLPSWIGDEAFHRSHRSNLLRKDQAHYSKFFNDPDDLEYVWPRKL